MPDLKLSTTEGDQIDHPSHYGGDTDYEPIKIIFAMGWGPEFCKGNALKYICRAGKKEGESVSKDLRKAAWYLNYLADELEKAEAEA